MVHRSTGPNIQTARVHSNVNLCREHFRLTLSVPTFPPARPGQFVHLCPEHHAVDSNASPDQPGTWFLDLTVPMLRRAFSIAGLRRTASGVEIDLIYRVVGTATRWMESLKADDPVSILGPLGNNFPISQCKPLAWLVSGGVGLPPMLWLAEALRAASKQAVAFCGAQRADLFPLNLNPAQPADRTARTATPTAAEFSERGTPVVLSTDDGSLGFRGYVAAAMSAFHDANLVDPQTLVVYTCGPEPMMRAVADFCTARMIECYVCMERNMACGTGMCQSCVVPVHEAAEPDGWCYRLCCTDGPIFEASSLLWQGPT